MTTYRAVIIGLTGIGARRPAEPANLPLYGTMPRSHAAAYHRHPATELVGVCDIRQVALDDFQKNWQDVWPTLHYTTDYRAMLAELKPDFVSVVTPDHLHADITVAAAEGGAKAILCEKPIATTLADADRMIAAAEANGVLLSVEHTRRWSPIFHAARELIRSGELGPLRTIVCNQLGPRAMLFRNGTHLVDIVNFFAESDPQWVLAELEPGFDHFVEYQGDGGHDPNSEPYVSAYIHFANGVRAFYNSIKTTLSGSQLELTCDDGRVEVSDRGVSVLRGTSSGAWSAAPVQVGDYMLTFQLGAVAELVRLVEEGGTLISPAREARKCLEIMLAMLRSNHLGNARVNFPLT